MQNQFLITIDSGVTTDFAFNFLKNVNFIKTIEPHNGKSKSKADIAEVTLIAEKSLADEWLSEEDNRWDKLL